MFIFISFKCLFILLFFLLAECDTKKIFVINNILICLLETSKHSQDAVHLKFKRFSCNLNVRQVLKMNMLANLSFSYLFRLFHLFITLYSFLLSLAMMMFLCQIVKEVVFQMHFLPFITKAFFVILSLNFV